MKVASMSSARAREGFTAEKLGHLYDRLIGNKRG
jgi:hypothetical protein